jgi:Cys-tRNA(Pro)/Cys-tRNA(Cys) deacylase
MAVKKTNAARLVDAAGMAYELVEYPVDEEHLDATAVATAVGVAPETVFKTLVARGDDSEVRVFCVPGNQELDLKKAAAAVGCSRIHLVPVSELRSLTGYVRGGCSPLGMSHDYPTFIDEVAFLYETIYVSAGRRGLQLRISPADLARLARAAQADLV